MKYIKFNLFLFIALFAFQTSIAQLDRSSNANKTIDLRPLSGKSFPSSNLGIPNRNKKGLSMEKDGFDMTEQPSFMDPSDLHEDRINKRLKGPQREPKILDEYKNDMDFGEFKTSSGKITIACRDHMMFDGDRVQVLLNGKVLADNVLLESSFKTFTIELKEGFNKIEFVALNQGSAGPNTAELKVFDENGNLMISNVWNLLVGVKAKAMVIKE
ncbi:hypothetical protein [Psychroflexus planctonicus]|uniref:Secreted protein n=1 Tax=Psychroflexus planctonicus TaxID=1526575 RepID=A0ABQ1SMU6_9FLAO|nr:hypothetical protein [Psychroflexus planctonicus]GGE43817.1 hypothetical protein GCM10010832_24770 [Psychroflexus planctonicus]